MANSSDPHRPFHGSDHERRHFTADQLRGIPAPSKVFALDQADPPPPFLPDLPDVRREYAEYLSSSRRCDDTVSAILRAVDEAGQTVAGITTPDDVHGRSLTGLLRGTSEPDRERIFTVFHETSAKRRFEMRCVQEADYGYIWNAWSDGSTTYRAENMEGRTWPAMTAAYDGDGAIAARVDFYLHRHPEELYDLRADPYGLRNLADSSAHADQLAAMRTHMSAWMETVADPLADTFAERTRQ